MTSSVGLRPARQTPRPRPETEQPTSTVHMTKFSAPTSVALVLLGATAPSAQFLSPAPRFLTPSELATFRRDGVVLVRQLISRNLLRSAQASAVRGGKKSGGQPPRIEPGSSVPLSSAHFLHARPLTSVTSVAGTARYYSAVEYQGWRTDKALRRVAFDSAAASVVAQAIGLSVTQPLRVMKDAMLYFSPGNLGCGWHVDDKFFWPTFDVPPDSTEPVGANVWIALTRVNGSRGGGLAVSAGSHKADWREECRKHIAGEIGGGTGYPSTCTLAERSPECVEKLEARKVLHDMAPGDALVHSRYCFHRGEPFVDAAAGVPRRVAYSVRYEPASSRMFPNNFEAALATKQLRGGEPIARSAHFFPQVWPRGRVAERLRLALGPSIANDGQIPGTPNLFFPPANFTDAGNATLKNETPSTSAAEPAGEPRAARPETMAEAKTEV